MKRFQGLIWQANASVWSLLALLALPAWGIPENADYESAMRKTAMPFVQEHLKLSSFTAKDGTKITFGLMRTPKAKRTLVLSPGRSESIVGFTELIYDWQAQGYHIAIIDHRGQGFSQRLVTTSDVGHVKRFQDYTDDFQIFLNQFVAKQLPGPYFLLATSMGSAIALPVLVEQPTFFSAAALAVPMFKIRFSWIPEFFVQALFDFLSWLGQDTEYAPTRSAYDLAQTFKGNPFTSSQKRFEFDIELTKLNPTIAVGGSSVTWVREALGISSRLRSMPEKVKTPLLILQAGKESMLRNEAHAEFCEKAPDCRLKRYADAQHWILMENDVIRNQVFRDLESFFTDYEPGGP